VRLEKAYKEQQQSLLQAEQYKNEALEKSIRMKDEFLATISHEFKTPLSVINAAVQTIEKIYGNQIPDPVRKYLKRILMNSFRQLRLVNNLLDITRYNAGYLKVNNKNLDIVSLSNSILKSVEPYAKQKGVELIFSSEADFKEIALDEEKYERILLNLLSNAIKFTHKGHGIYIHISCKRRKVTVTVRDEGIGIPKSKQKMIFERFGQVDSSLSRQAEGTGIGLSIVKTLVEGMKGTITVESEINQGSIFTVTLPVMKLKQMEPQKDISGSIDTRIIRATAIEFSDIYLE
jgi:signal transduction histidine kinase